MQSLRLHERGPQIIHDLRLLGLPNVYDVPSQTLFGKTLAEVLDTLLTALAAAPKSTISTLPQEHTVGRPVPI